MSTPFPFETIYHHIDGDTGTPSNDHNPAEVLLRVLQLITRPTLTYRTATHSRAVAMAWLCGVYGSWSQETVAAKELMSVISLQKTTCKVLNELSAIGANISHVTNVNDNKESFNGNEDERILAQRLKHLRE